MSIAMIAVGWVLILFGTAIGAILIENLVHRRKMEREAMLHRRMGLGLRDSDTQRR